MLSFAGDVNFERFFESYRPIAYGAAWRVLQNRDDAEDVVQQVFLKVWHSPDAFRGGNLESWLTTLSKHRAIDQLRKRRRELQHRALENLAVNEPGEIAAALSNAWDLHSALGLLSLRQREALVTCFFGGLSHSEAALALGLPVGTLKTRIRAALHRLRKANLL